MNTQQLSLHQYFVENLFYLDITQKQTSTQIIMQILYDHVTTRTIPTIVELLETNLPNVLNTHCFNDEGLPFEIEVRQTELGHLFEHVLLEYLCQFKIAKGAQRACYEGRTKWNWIRDPKGKFYIRLTCGSKDADILPAALEKTIELMKIILANHQDQLFLTNSVYEPENGFKNGRKTRKTK